MRSALITLLSSLALAASRPAEAQVAVDGTPPLLSRTTASLSREAIMSMIVAEANASGVVPPELALAVAREESNFNPDAISSAGARGVMQIMPATALSEFGVGADDLWDPAINVRTGIAFLARLYTTYGRRWDAALSHYNGGSLRTGMNGLALPHRYTQSYVTSVLRRWDSYAADPAIVALVGGQGASPSITNPDGARPTSQYNVPAYLAVTGVATSGYLREDIRQARLSFRQALREHEAIVE
jgi:hypothetical protein